MRYIYITLSLLLTLNITAQELPKKSKIFVRVYNNYGGKIAKGKILKITDNSLVLKKGSETVTVLANDIGSLKTKRGPGHNAFLGGAAGLTFITFVMSKEGVGGPYGAAAAIVAIPMMVGIFSGIGYLTSIFKDPKIYLFAGDLVKWKIFKEEMYRPVQ